MPKPKKFEPVLYNEVFQKYPGMTFGQQACSWQQRIDMARMRKERSDKFRKCMRDEDVGVMLLLAAHNIRYATGSRSRTYTSGLDYAIMPHEGDPVYFAHGTPGIWDRRFTWQNPNNIRYAIPAALGLMASGLWVDPPTRKYQLEKLATQLKDTLKERGLAKEMLALDVADHGVMEALGNLGIKTCVKAEIGVRASEIKTQDEIECFKLSASIADTVHYELAKFIEPGKTELELTGWMRYIAAKCGAECSQGPGPVAWSHTWPNTRQRDDRQLRPGDLVIADAAFIGFEGYQTCYYRTFSVLTQPSQAAKDAMKRVYDWTYESLEDCKPGNTTWDIVKHWPSEEKRWKIGPDWCWGDNLLHGIGLFHYGPPQGCYAWSQEYPYPLKEGQVFAIELQDGVGDGQGVRMEEMVVVTKDGYEVLTRYPADIITTCPLGRTL